MKHEDLERLETISQRLEHVPEKMKKQVYKDILWLTTKLREAYIRIEREEDEQPTETL